MGSTGVHEKRAPTAEFTIIGSLPEENGEPTYRIKYADPETAREGTRDGMRLQTLEPVGRLDKEGPGPFAAGTNPSYRH